MAKSEQNSGGVTGVLYSLYRSTHGVGGLLGGRVTKLGLIVLLSFPILFMVGLTYFRLSSFYLFVFFVVLVVSSFIAAFFRNGSLKVKRMLPKQALAGEELFYRAEVTNTGKRKLSSALILDDVPNTCPSRKEFLNTVEPGEELRNVVDRFLKYYRWTWLVKRKASYKSSPLILPELQVEETQMVALSCTPLKRGRIDFPDTKLILPDGIGLFQKIIKLQPASGSVTVLPKRYKLPPLSLDGLSRNSVGGSSVAQTNGQTDEVVGLREYRPGDPPKHIHWKSWAKTGKPIVREYEDVFFPRYGLVLDTACAHEQASMFEEAVSVAASFVRSVDTKECLLDLIFLSQGAKIETVGTGVAKEERMLELLATVDIDLEPDWDSLSQQVLKHSGALSACIVVLVDLDDHRLKLIRRWRATGLTMLIIVITNDIDSEAEAEDLGIVFISTRNIEADLMRKLRIYNH